MSKQADCKLYESLQYNSLEYHRSYLRITKYRPIIRVA